jgi:hypothetical protein
MFIMVSYISSAYTQIKDAYEGVKNPPYQAIDAKLEQIESALNKLGWIPGISIVSGTVREGLGYVEILGGLAAAALRNIAASITSDKAAKERLYKQAEVELSYAINGLGNVVRGNIEKLPFWDLWAIAVNKAVLFTYDLLQVRMNYGHEEASYKHPILRSFPAEQEMAELPKE